MLVLMRILYSVWKIQFPALQNEALMLKETWGRTFLMISCVKAITACFPIFTYSCLCTFVRFWPLSLRVELQNLISRYHSCTIHHNVRAEYIWFWLVSTTPWSLLELLIPVARAIHWHRMRSCGKLEAVVCMSDSRVFPKKKRYLLERAPESKVFPRLSSILFHSCCP